MGSGHGHGAAGKNKRNLKTVFCLTALYLVAEVIGGLLTNSLALLADAGHMLTDVAGLGLALFAISFAERPATPERTFGFYRVEILAALANAVLLIGISLYILYEAHGRFRNPPAVASKTMLLVATVGLAVNIVGIFILRAGSAGSLNIKGAYFEVLSDMLTSMGVIIAGGAHVGDRVVLRRPADLGRHRAVHTAAHLEVAERGRGRVARRHTV